MRVLLDTNVLIAALISHGNCSEVLECCAVRHEIIGSEYLLDEFRRKLAGKFKMAASDVTAAEALLRGRMSMVKPAGAAGHVSRDPKDEQVLAAAVAGKCACLVTGDKDLLVLKRVGAISILDPRQFWRFEAEKR